jgi:hypothetical protein
MPLGGKGPSIFVSLVNSLWTIIKLVFFVAILGAIGLGVYWHFHVGEEIRWRVEAMLAAKYPQLKVTVGGARVVEGEGIEIRDLSLKQPNRNGANEDLLHVDEIFLHCSTLPQDLVNQQLHLRRVVIRRAELTAVRQADGGWNLAQLAPQEESGDEIAEVVVEDSTLIVVDATKGPDSELTFRDVALTLRPRTDPPPASTAAASATGTPDTDFKPHYQVEGTLAASFCPEIEVTGVFHPQDKIWRVGGVFKNLRITRQVLAAMPLVSPAKLKLIESFSCEAGLSFNTLYDGKSTTPWQFAVVGQLWNGHYEDHRIPYPLTNIHTQFHFNNRGIALTNLSASIGGGTVTGSVVRYGYHDYAPARIQASIRDLWLDKNTNRHLPPEAQQHLRTFSPAGLLDADVEFAFDGRTWTPDVSVRCRDVSLTFERFAYPIDHAAGSLELHNNQLEVDLQAQAGATPVAIKGKLVDPGGARTGWLTIDTEGTIPIDERLLSALDESSQKLVRSFEPRGQVAISARFEKSSAGHGQPHQHVVFQLRDGALKYDRFPYPFERIRGTLEMIDKQWKFTDLEGRNDSGYVTCSGGWTPYPGEGGQLALDFIGSDIALEDELRDALGSHVRRVWSELRPRGSIDHVTCSLRWDSRDQQTRLDVRGQKWPKTQSVEGRSVSIDPVWFPYHLDQVTGALHYENGRLEITNLRARHGEVSLVAGAICEVQPDGAWQFGIRDLSADRFHVTRELISALPEGLGQTLQKLDVSGPISVRGDLLFSGDSHNENPLRIDWDLSFDIENGDVLCGVPLKNIHGGVRLFGTSAGDQFLCRGELNVDSLLLSGHQLTQVRGPLLIEPARISLGEWATRPEHETRPRAISGNLLGGVFQSDAYVDLESNQAFAVRAKLHEGDLARFARENLRTPEQISGKLYAVVQLQGTCEGTHTLKGGGHVRLRDADIYELPVMVQLLKVLSIRRPDKTAFTSSDLDFRVEGDHVLLDRFDFHGDAVGLKGVGSVNLDGHIDSMEFYTLVGRAAMNIPVIQPMLGEASRQLLVIRVWGTLDNPQVRRQALPGLNETLHQLFPEEVARRRQAEQNRIGPRAFFQRSRIVPR